MNSDYFIPHHTQNNFLLLLFGFVPIQRDALARSVQNMDRTNYGMESHFQLYLVAYGQWKVLNTAAATKAHKSQI